MKRPLFFARLFVLVALVALGACRPELGERAADISGPRVLAVRAEPPEVTPGQEVSYEALVVGPEGRRASSIAWAFCAEPRSPNENNAVSAACLDPSLPLVGVGEGLVAAVPKEACAVFGPEPPPGGFRPRDPDATGGFFQPLRLNVDGVTAFAEQRVQCNIASVAVGAALDYKRRYVANKNPAIARVVVRVEGREVTSVPRDETAEMEVAWPAEAAEGYLVVNLEKQVVEERREAMRVSWFSTRGRFAKDRTGRDADDLALTSGNTWTAPEGAGDARVFVVLRDARGGVAFAEIAVAVTAVTD